MIDANTTSIQEIIHEFEEIEDYELKKEIGLGLLNSLIGYIHKDNEGTISYETIGRFLKGQVNFNETGNSKYI